MEGFLRSTGLTLDQLERRADKKGETFYAGVEKPGRQAAEIAFKHVREGNGPVLMELNTYRYRGHSMSDPAKYRTREEVQDMREQRDPIEALKKTLLAAGKTEDELKDIDKRIRAAVSEAADFAENSPEPEMSELYTDVLVESY